MCESFMQLQNKVKVSLTLSCFKEICVNMQEENYRFLSNSLRSRHLNGQMLTKTYFSTLVQKDAYYDSIFDKYVMPMENVKPTRSSYLCYYIRNCFKYFAKINIEKRTHTRYIKILLYVRIDFHILFVGMQEMAQTMCIEKLF